MAKKQKPRNRKKTARYRAAQKAKLKKKRKTRTGLKSKRFS